MSPTIVSQRSSDLHKRSVLIHFRFPAKHSPRSHHNRLIIANLSGVCRSLSPNSRLGAPTLHPA